MGLDRDNLIRKAPAVSAGRARGRIHSLFLSKPGIHSIFPSTGGFSGTSSERAVFPWKAKFHNHGCVRLHFSSLP